MRILLRLSISLLCLSIGLLLWRNLALHYADIEQILPSLQASSLWQGKKLFIFLILLTLIGSFWLLSNAPWRLLLVGANRPWRLSLAAVSFSLSFIPLFWFRFGIAAWLLWLLFITSFFISSAGLFSLCALAGRHLPLPSLRSARWNRMQPYLPAVMVLLAALYFSAHCFANLPHIEDSIAQLLQARIFATGHAAAPPFEPREFFFFGFMADSPRWFCQYPPGHALLLALGVLAGIPHWINPLLGFLCLLLFHRLMVETQDESAARWGTWAMALSPFVIFMSAEFMNHSTALAASLLGWLALKKGEGGKQGWLIIAGLSFGYATATRPLEGALFALIGGLLIVSNFGHLRLGSWIKAAPFALAFVCVSSLYAIQNLLTTSHPFTSGYAMTWGGSGMGFGPINWGPAHTFGYGLVNTSMSIAGLNVFLWELPIPALLPFFLWALLGERLSRWDQAFLASVILVPLGYLFYYFHDFSFGVRYYYVIVPQLIYFSVKGIRALKAQMVGSLNISDLVGKRSLCFAGLILLLMQLFIAIPYRASVYADSYWGTDDAPMKAAHRQGLHNAIVFIENHPWEILMTKLHSLGFIMGDAHRFLFLITQEGLDQVLMETGVNPDSLWNARVDLWDLEQRLYAWNRKYLEAGNPPIDPWAESGYYTYFSNGAVHLDPRNRQPDVILARDLGDHNRVLMQTYPERKAYRFAWDDEARRFQIRSLPIPSE